AVYPGIAMSRVAEQRQPVVDVVLHVQQRGPVFQLGPAPGLGRVDAAVGRVRDAHAIRHGIHARGRIPVFVLQHQVQAGDQFLAAVIQAQRPDGNLAVLVVYFRIALFVAAVDPHAPLLLFAEAAADVDLRPAHRTLPVIGGQARHRLVLRALGHYVDDAADAAVGRYAVQQ